MDTINYYIERIEKASEKLIKETQLLKKYNKEYDFESLALDGKRGARISSDLYLSYTKPVTVADVSLPHLTLTLFVFICV